MKLIQTLALATALATVAAGQSTGSATTPQSSPTPAATKTGASTTSQAGKTSAATKPDPKSKSNKKPAPVISLKSSQNGAKATGTTATKGTNQKTAGTSAGSNGTAKPAAAAVKTGTIAGKTPASTTKTPGAAVAAKPTGTQAATAATKKTKAATSAKAKKPAKPVIAKTKPKTLPKGKQPSVAEVAATQKREPSKPLMGAHGRRDPFVTVIRSASNIAPTSTCTSGKRCLYIPELVLQGTVRDISGKMMAVVVTSSKRTYMLRENDQLFNGTVEKITSDSVIFREFVKDNLGREAAHEVVKKLSPTTTGM